MAWLLLEANLVSVRKLNTVIKTAGYLAVKSSSKRRWKVASFSTTNTNLALVLIFLISETWLGMSEPLRERVSSIYIFAF